jgi:hypothetical protein
VPSRPNLTAGGRCEQREGKGRTRGLLGSDDDDLVCEHREDVGSLHRGTASGGTMVRIEEQGRGKGPEVEDGVQTSRGSLNMLS